MLFIWALPLYPECINPECINPEPCQFPECINPIAYDPGYTLREWEFRLIKEKGKVVIQDRCFQEIDVVGKLSFKKDAFGKKTWTLKFSLMHRNRNYT